MPWVEEYLTRRRLAEIGIHAETLKTMPYAHAMALNEISATIERLKSEDLKKRKR